jgi:ABC-2 type transport system permease protein
LATWIGFVATVAGAAAVASRWWFLVNLSSFWFIGDIRGLLSLAAGLQLFCSGSVVPLQFFPDELGELLRRTPFATMAQLPAEVFLGLQGAVPVLGAQAAWALVLHGCGLIVLRRAARKLVIDGG